MADTMIPRDALRANLTRRSFLAAGAVATTAAGATIAGAAVAADDDAPLVEAWGAYRDAKERYAALRDRHDVTIAVCGEIEKLEHLSQQGWGHAAKYFDRPEVQYARLLEIRNELPPVPEAEMEALAEAFSTAADLIESTPAHGAMGAAVKLRFHQVMLHECPNERDDGLVTGALAVLERTTGVRLPAACTVRPMVTPGQVRMMLQRIYGADEAENSDPDAPLLAAWRACVAANNEWHEAAEASRLSPELEDQLAEREKVACDILDNQPAQGPLGLAVKAAYARFLAEQDLVHPGCKPLAELAAFASRLAGVTLPVPIWDGGADDNEERRLAWARGAAASC